MGHRNQCKHLPTHKQHYVYVPKFVPSNKLGLRHLWEYHKTDAINRTQPYIYIYIYWSILKRPSLNRKPAPEVCPNCRRSSSMECQFQVCGNILQLSELSKDRVFAGKGIHCGFR